MRNLLFLLVISLFPTCVPGQNLQSDWQKSFGHDATINAVVEATNGYLLAVGQTTAKTKGGTDGLVIIADHSTGQVMAEVQYGGGKDDVFYAAVQTFDGHFLLAGATASAGKGGQDAWLMLIDEKGQKVWETTFGTPGRDECRKMLLLPDGKVLLAGYRNDQKNGDVWLATVEGQTLLWEKNLGAGEFDNLNGLVPAVDGGFVFSGNTGKKAEKGSGDAYLAKADVNGNLLWKKWFGESGWEENLDLIATRDGGFALAGLTKSKGAGDLDAWLVKTSRDGFRQWDKTYGGKDADIANLVRQTDDDGFLLAGSSKSQRSGARFTDAYVVKISAGGEQKWEEFYGEDRDDAFTTACLLHQGSLVVAGDFNGNAATAYRFSDPQSLPMAMTGMRDLATLGLSAATVPTADGTLLPGEHSYLAFQISNTTDLDLSDLRVTVDNKTGQDLTAWSTSYLGLLRTGKNLEARIPLAASNELQPGEQTLSITVSAGSKTLKSFEKNITLRRPLPATLLIASHRFELSNRSDEVTLHVQIANQGDSSSRAAEVLFSLPAGLKAAGATALPMGIVAAHTQREATLVFIKTPQFNAPVATVTCAVLENSREKVRKTLEYQTGTGKSTINGPILIWTDPAPHETGTNKVRKSDDHFEFKMTVVSPKPVNTKNIKMKVNGVEMDGSKFNEEDLSPARQENTQYTYTYRNKIPLQQGSNRVEVVVDDQVSDPLDVEFVPERANLFLLAIGPKHEDLLYPAKDAADFAQAFANQGGEGKLFNEVIVTTLITPEKTDKNGILKAMYDQAYLWDDKQIKPGDVLIVFISSHGKIVDNRFKILQTGYDPKYDRLAVDYKTDILEALGNINCKKLIFLDACHSGGAKDGFGGLSQAVVDLAKTQPGVSTLTSCGSLEKSYEDKTWENGAFTEALLEAFSGKTCQDTQGSFCADANGDHIIRLGELYDYLRRRVPEMVQSAIPNAPTAQTPFMPESQLDKDLPLYYLDKK